MATSELERELVGEVRRLIEGTAGEATLDVNWDDHAALLSSLGYYIDGLIGEACGTRPGIDDVFVAAARSERRGQIAVAGLACLLSGHLTAFHIDLRIAADVDEVEWLSCRLGERERNGEGMRTIPNGSSAESKWLYRIEQVDPEELKWVYVVTYGE